MLSVKARELDEEKKAMADFGSSDSGASLGDILGAALSRAQKKDEKDEEEDNKVAFRRPSKEGRLARAGLFLGKMGSRKAPLAAFRPFSF